MNHGIHLRIDSLCSSQNSHSRQQIRFSTRCSCSSKPFGDPVFLSRKCTFSSRTSDEIMIEKYWGLKFNPFQNVISDRWYYESPMHEETLSRLYYIIEQRQKCGLLLGEEGTGKSLL